MCIPLPLPGDIRYRYDLAGGATMDIGCYAINIVRFLAGAEPRSWRPRPGSRRPNVDRWMRAELRFADGRTGRVDVLAVLGHAARVQARVRGEPGRDRVFNPVAPAPLPPPRVRPHGRHGRERWPARPPTPTSSAPSSRTCATRSRMPTDAGDAVANMRVIDAVYDRVGMRRRGS